jgi:beta-glucosidase
MGERPITQAVRGTAEDDKDVDIDQLLDDMGWKGQIGQMAQMDIKELLTTEEPIQLDQALLNEYIGELGVGSVLNNHYLWKAADYRREVIRLQKTAQKFRRPPVVWGLDSVHGANYVLDAVITPQPINLAASFNRTLSVEAGKLASKDTRRAGIPWLFSPLLGLSWNPLWSRVYETFGEDPLLVGDMAKSMILGIQSRNNENEYDEYENDGNETISGLLLPSRAAASAKHFVGYSDPHNGHDRAPSVIPMRHLYQYFLLPWRKALLGGTDDEARPATVMESYTEIDGVPNVANRRTLDRILRQELNYTDGMVVTDYDEVNNLERWHHTANDAEDALLSAMEDGTIDMSMMGGAADVRFFVDTMEKFAAGNENQAMRDRIRKSARRVLKLKRDLNMFEESFQLEPLSEDEDQSTEHDFETVLDMTRQSMVMTKNDNKALPLIDTKAGASSAPLKVLVTGPTSDSLSFQTGGWSGEWQGVDSRTEREWFLSNKYQTVKGALERESDKFEVTHECGVDVLGNECFDPHELADQQADDESQSKNLFDVVRGWFHGGSDSAVVSEDSPLDAIVVCLGEENYAEKPGDITDLRLPQGQYDLVEALKDAVTGGSSETKIILVYFGGRPRLLADVVPLVDAVVIGFLPGPFAGNAIADFLTGRVSPSARLPLTYPKHQDLSGIPYLHEVSDMCTRDTGQTLPHWDYVPCEVQWPFGHGLTYAQFKYDDVRLSTKTLQQHWHDDDDDVQEHDDEQLTVKVMVTNTGDVGGAETVLFFTFDEFRSTTPEYKRLRGYEKVWLEPRESKEVSITISLQDDLRFVGAHDDSHYILQDGLEFRVAIGSGSDCRNGRDHLCSEVVTIRTEEDYVGACEAACNVWKESGDQCAKDTFLQNARTTGAAIAACRKSCSGTHFSNDNDVEMNNDGWGWNYVQCLESIVWNQRFDSETDCWKLTSLCRDVTQTTGMDEFGNDLRGSGRIVSGSFADPPASAIIVAILAGAFASAMIYRSVRGGLSITATPKDAARGDEYGNVEFSMIQ